MNVYQEHCIMDLFQAEGTVEQKVKRVQDFVPNMSDYWSDWTAFFGYKKEQLPIIKGVEVKTRFQDDVREYIMLTQYPEQVLPEVQKTIMRLLGGLGGFEYQKWGVGQMTNAMNGYFLEYRNTHPGVEFQAGSNYGYPKVYIFDVDPVKEASNESYSVMELTGFVLD